MRDGSWTGNGRKQRGRHPLGLPACCETPRPNRRRVYVLVPRIARAGYGIILSIHAGTILSAHSLRRFRGWDYPIGSASTGARNTGLSNWFREGTGLNRLRESRGKRPSGQQVWDYPIGFEVHRACRRRGTILSDSPGLSYRFQFLWLHGVGLSYRVHRDYPIDGVGLSDWFSWTILLPFPPGPLPAVGLTGSPSYCHILILFIAVPGSPVSSRSR